MSVFYFFLISELTFVINTRRKGIAMKSTLEMLKKRAKSILNASLVKTLATVDTPKKSMILLRD